ncbi:eukaryotic translation initiation factor 2-alpha kinase 4 [Plakobranchus ocellatus]|uniref:Eukaryotic translation initiation factor 2-alpha kinase 4 n=1 Tax=Plakobranchus ocellatus TaxID=259542 RepID=A0AAV4DTC4_9GAST|nr:eukaryotic translation initiation factor 2-alpha kinase 4 [Plakobranchus ocellatus]
MSSISSNQERQDEEYQVLESIFGSDLVDLRHKVWKVSRPMELKLTLKPQQSMGGQSEVYAQLDMIVKCSAQYPDVVPEITLSNWKGLSNSHVEELKSQLLKEAAENIGEVMLWQLATYVQEFLHKHNKPPELSFYEQMMTNKKQQEERMQEQERVKQEEKVTSYDPSALQSAWTNKDEKVIQQLQRKHLLQLESYLHQRNLQLDSVPTDQVAEKLLCHSALNYPPHFNFADLNVVSIVLIGFTVLSETL